MQLPIEVQAGLAAGHCVSEEITGHSSVLLTELAALHWFIFAASRLNVVVAGVKLRYYYYWLIPGRQRSAIRLCEPTFYLYLQSQEIATRNGTNLPTKPNLAFSVMLANRCYRKRGSSRIIILSLTQCTTQSLPYMCKQCKHSVTQAHTCAASLI